MITPLSSRTILALSASLVIAATIGFVIYQKVHVAPPPFDANAKKILNELGHARVYTAHVNTSAMFTDRVLQIDGMYLVDEPQKKYMTMSTTTMTVRGVRNQPHAFTLKNISIGDDVYSKIETTSSIFKQTIPASPLWRHFKKNSVPSQFADIAVVGPILDNVLIFSVSGRYLVFVNKKEEVILNRTLMHYTFTLSHNSAKNRGGTLEALLERIGKEGMVDVWIDYEKEQVPFFRFSNATYTSTTTLLDVNTPLSIEPPISF